MERLFADIDTLPENQRTALLLKAPKARSMDEIAGGDGHLGQGGRTPPSRARATLRARMERTKDKAVETSSNRSDTMKDTDALELLTHARAAYRRRACSRASKRGIGRVKSGG